MGMRSLQFKGVERDVSRLAFHLASDVGLRDAANGFTGIKL